MRCVSKKPPIVCSKYLRYNRLLTTIEVWVVFLHTHLDRHVPHSLDRKTVTNFEVHSTLIQHELHHIDRHVEILPPTRRKIFHHLRKSALFDRFCGHRSGKPSDRHVRTPGKWKLGPFPMTGSEHLGHGVYQLCSGIRLQDCRHLIECRAIDSCRKTRPIPIAPRANCFLDSIVAGVQDLDHLFFGLLHAVHETDHRM